MSRKFVRTVKEDHTEVEREGHDCRGCGKELLDGTISYYDEYDYINDETGEISHG
jgi:hypothetical protein